MARRASGAGGSARRQDAAGQRPGAAAPVARRLTVARLASLPTGARTSQSARTGSSSGQTVSAAAAAAAAAAAGGALLRWKISPPLPRWRLPRGSGRQRRRHRSRRRAAIARARRPPATTSPSPRPRPQSRPTPLLPWVPQLQQRPRTEQARPRRLCRPAVAVIVVLVVVVVVVVVVLAAVVGRAQLLLIPGLLLQLRRTPLAVRVTQHSSRRINNRSHQTGSGGVQYALSPRTLSA
jgi:hypothetical protein